MRRNFGVALAALTLTVVGLSGCAPPVETPPAPAAVIRETPRAADVAETPPATEPEAIDATATTALSLLATLPVKGRAPKTGYDRVDQFGTAWKDVDRNGCDTRNDILRRDLVNAVLDGSCTVLSGQLDDPYTGGTIQFLRGNETSILVHIEHVVALSDAWQKGAQQLAPDQRIALANDPHNLLAVDGPTNSAKGDGDAATWLPPNKAFRCEYVTLQVQVKSKYSLWVTAAEAEAMMRVLNSCGAQPVVAPVPVPVPPAIVEPEPVAPPPPVSGTVHPGGFCSEQGTTGVGKNGKTYTCGKSGADAGGRFHWNA